MGDNHNQKANMRFQRAIDGKSDKSDMEKSKARSDPEVPINDTDAEESSVEGGSKRWKHEHLVLLAVAVCLVIVGASILAGVLASNNGHDDERCANLYTYTGANLEANFVGPDRRGVVYHTNRGSHIKRFDSIPFQTNQLADMTENDVAYSDTVWIAPNATVVCLPK